ncbi:Non-reducing end beta-L-arabinofuranosidase [Aquisphaera giovannonii]|uniref:Non-reducing end beta-L-arabinofuranosidase n=1 Tax=Aquisphaera giovannonii TaxID=406548 RepID=A0A5B9VWL0_9BACT|nr:beta-L-arabinofuranosidase domain-containing protein [Aquisphaera giovannonii]QEH32165.1 Non-reducing end beta-L-arabinofuranosidase [Aquisphaera giovannonii]
MTANHFARPRRRGAAAIATTMLAALFAPAVGVNALANDAPRPALRPAEPLKMTLEGPVRGYLDRITENWLIPATAGNPAILAMFADRDRPPYRNLLPWSGEFAGKYLTGATAVLRATNDPRLRAHLERFVAEFVALQDADGYLGPFPKGSRLTGQAPNVDGKPGPTWDAWGHYHAIVGLLAWHDLTGDAKALDAARRIGDLFVAKFLGAKSPRLVDTGSTETNLAPAHGMAILYARTKDPRHLELARQLVAEFAAVGPDGKPLAGDYLRRGLAGSEYYQLPRPRWESLHPILALAELAAAGGAPEAADAGKAFANLWWSIARLDRHNNGGFSSGEQAQGNPYDPRPIETCCTIAWMADTVAMLEMTGDPIAADELELSTFNSAMGMYSPSGRWSTYNTPMDGDRRANSHEIVFQARPGSPELNCCSVNAARGLGMLPEWALMESPDGRITLNWYGPGSYAAETPSGEKLRLETASDYPRSGLVKVRVRPEQPGRFALRLRIPHWSSKTRVAVNGEPVGAVKPATYLELDREWKAGDEVALELDMAPHLWAGEREAAGRVSIYRGPILLAFDQRFNPGKPADPPSLGKSITLGKLVDWSASPTPVLLVEASTTAGPILLCDFASAGADGSPYRTWLRAEQAGPGPFRRERPWRSRPAAP